MIIVNRGLNRPPVEKQPPKEANGARNRVLANRARENARHEQEHTASRDYDMQRRGGKPEEDVKPPRKS